MAHVRTWRELAYTFSIAAEHFVANEITLVTTRTRAQLKSV